MIIDATSRRFIESQRVARLATVDGLQRPHVVPICFTLLDDTIYSVIDEKPKRGEPANLRRVRNISANPWVQVLFDVYHEDWSQLRFLQIRGVARVLHDGDERERALASLCARYDQYAEMNLKDRPVIAVDPTAISSWTGGA